MARIKKEGRNSDLGPQPAMPVRYRCKVGGEWKPLNLFSKNQQQLIQRQLSTHGKVDAANCGMTCVEHSATFRGEIRCEMCGLVKPFDEFSKTMRKSDEPMCLRCTAWGETQEPGVTPTPLQTGHISVEEQNKEVWNKKFTESTDFFPDDSLPQAPITALSSLGISTTSEASKLGSRSVTTGSRHLKSSASRGASSVVSAPRTESSGQMPPHLESIVSRLMQKDGLTPSSNSHNQTEDEIPLIGTQDVRGWLGGQENPSDTASGCFNPEDIDRNAKHQQSVFAQRLPPHLQSMIPSTAVSPDLLSQGHIRSNVSNSQPRSISTATTMRDAEVTQPKRPDIPYNAWDNSGRRHAAIKSPTESDPGSISTDSIATSHNLTSVGDWDNANVAEPVAPSSRNKWHKPPRIAAQQQGPTDHISAEHIDPGVDRQRRMRYCQTEDSNY